MKITAAEMEDVLRRLPDPNNYRRDVVTMHVYDQVLAVSPDRAADQTMTELRAIEFVRERAPEPYLGYVWTMKL